MVQRVWRKFSPYWHIITFLCSGVVITIVWINDVSGFGGRIEKLEKSNQAQSESIVRIDYNVQMIANKVGVTPFGRNKND